VSEAISDFERYYARRKQALGVLYEGDEFLYPSDGPWPEASFDYPYGQAPQVMNIPVDEQRDWQRSIGRYYTDNALGTFYNRSPFGVAAAEYARDDLVQNGISGYAEVSDDDFVALVCEGLFSKFLSRLDPQDVTLFGLKPTDLAPDSPYEYFKSDYRCMMVVQDTWPGEYACPTIVLLRRERGSKKRYADEGAYDLRAIAVARRPAPDSSGATPSPFVYEFPQDLVFWREQHGTTPGWFLAKYFVLQGAAHRINLIDHVKVHFPPDAINALTKTVLPKWHLVHQLLEPHFRLTLPVNNAVLEGQRSLINRDTWYPWSPFAAVGNEIRKLFPFAWAGAGYYGDKYYGKDADQLGRNSSYPAFRYSSNPDGTPGADDPSVLVANFIGMDCSRYGAFLKTYYAPILKFVTEALKELGDPQGSDPKAQVAWLEVQHWAHEIAQLLPGFPDENQIVQPGELARVCAMVIWNAAVVHSSDHTTLHLMMDTKPVPFVLRVPPPTKRDAVVEETLESALGPTVAKYLTAGIGEILKAWESQGLKEKLEGMAVEKLLEDIGQIKLSHRQIPLCWPTDLMYARMADLLFYRPHNTTLLYDCEYAFERDASTDEEKALQALWIAAGRPVLTDAQKTRLRGLRRSLQAALDAVNGLYYKPDGTPVDPATGQSNYHSDTDPAMEHLNRFGFPKLRPGTAETGDTGVMLRREACIGAGVQY
jgi:hypothetical protein